MISAVILAAAMVTAPNLGVSEAPAAVSSVGNAHATFTVGNAGNVSERIYVQVTTTRPVKNNPNLYVPESEYDHYTTSAPNGFTLAPHAHKSVTVTITNPDGYAEHLAVVAEAYPVSNAGTARPRAAVAAKWTVTGKAGHAPSAVTVPTLHKSSTLPVAPIAAGLALLLALMAVCGVILRRRHRRA